MTVRVFLHLEPTGETEPAFAWWAESPDLPGFSAAADHLPEILRLVEAAVPEIAEELDLPVPAIDIKLATVASPNEADQPGLAVDGGSVKLVRVRQVALVA